MGDATETRPPSRTAKKRVVRKRAKKPETSTGKPPGAAGGTRPQLRWEAPASLKDPRRKSFPWLGEVRGTWSAALRATAARNKRDPHAGTIADLPSKMPVEVLGETKGWLHVEVTIGGSPKRGYVSRELVGFVSVGGVAATAPTATTTEPLVPRGYGSSELVPESEARAYQRRVEQEILEEAVLEQRKNRLQLQQELEEHPETLLTREEFLLLWTDWHPFDAEGHDVPPDACVLVNRSGECKVVTQEYAERLVAAGKLRPEAIVPYDPQEFEAIDPPGSAGVQRKLGPKELRRRVYDSLKDHPNYPTKFRATGNTTRNKITLKDLKAKLQKIERGEWKKVYKDGVDEYGDKMSVHYFESASGKVFDVKVKPGWSN